MCEGTGGHGFGGPLPENQVVGGDQRRAEPTGPAEHHLVWEWMLWGASRMGPKPLWSQPLCLMRLALFRQFLGLGIWLFPRVVKPNHRGDKHPWGAPALLWLWGSSSVSLGQISEEKCRNPSLSPSCDVLRRGVGTREAERAEELQSLFLMINAHFPRLAGLANQPSASLQSSCSY